jgi:hypothetical protein
VMQPTTSHISQVQMHPPPPTHSSLCQAADRCTLLQSIVVLNDVCRPCCVSPQDMRLYSVCPCSSTVTYVPGRCDLV